VSRNATTISAAVKLAIFTVTSILVTGLLVAIMGNIGFGGGQDYKAIFTNASMLQEGDDVRIAGVNVGDVQSVEHVTWRWSRARTPTPGLSSPTAPFRSRTPARPSISPSCSTASSHCSRPCSQIRSTS